MPNFEVEYKKQKIVEPTVLNFFCLQSLDFWNFVTFQLWPQWARKIWLTAIENLFELLSVAKPSRVLIRTDKFVEPIELLRVKIGLWEYETAFHWTGLLKELNGLYQRFFVAYSVTLREKNLWQPG